MKKRICFMLVSLMAVSLLGGCGGKSSGGSSGGEADGYFSSDEEGKVLNIYVWNDEWQKKFNENYPEVKKTSNDQSVTYLKDGTEVHWTINPN